MVLDPSLCDLEPNLDTFNRSTVNPLLQSISTCLKRNDPFTDQSAAALKALEPICLLVYKHYDQKIHQPSIEHIK